MPDGVGGQKVGGRSHPQKSERVLLLQFFLNLLHSPLQTGDLNTQQGLVLIQADEFPPLLCFQLDLQQLLFLVQELVQIAELGLNTLLQVGCVLLGVWGKKTVSRSKTSFWTWRRFMEASGTTGGC